MKNRNRKKKGWLTRVEMFFTGWRFPVFMLATLGVSWLLIIFMAFVPVPDSAWGSFAEDFKVWCFGYDPDTGSMQWIYLVKFTGNPLMLALIIGFVWKEPLQELRRIGYSAASGPVRSALMLVSLTAVSFYMTYEVPTGESFEFRPDAIRTAYEAPSFTLVNEHEKPVSLNDYDGEVILLTSVYASCGDTCPMILEQAVNVLDDLPAEVRDQVVLMAVTMQPEKDTPELLNRVARFYNLDEMRSHMLTGEPETVNALLDRLDVARNINTETGEIEHANLFMLIDRSGKIAYRFTLGERQSEWMKEAIRILVEEEPSSITQTLPSYE